MRLCGTIVAFRWGCSLVPRQNKAYRDLCSIYRSVDPKIGSLNTLEENFCRDELIEEKVRCLFASRGGGDVSSLVGHSCHEISEWRFCAGQDVEEGWMLELQTEKHPLFGSRWRVIEAVRVTVGTSGRVNQKFVRAMRVGGARGFGYEFKG